MATGFRSVSRYASVLVVVAVVATACAADEPVVGLPPIPTELIEVESVGSSGDELIHSVPLDTILFDTFDGGSVPLSEASPDLISSLLDAIRPMDDPAYESVDDATWLDDDDIVLGYVDDAGEAWAYPVRILDRHEIVNDELAGRSVLITYCPLCGSGVVYDRALGNDTLTFSNTSALHENDMVMVDRETGSYWWQVAGRGIVGPLTDRTLSPLSAEMARWPDWVERHPDTAVLAQPFGREYGPSPFVGYRERVDAGITPFPVSAEVLADERLSSAATVVVIESGGETWAWPVEPPTDREIAVGDRTLRLVTDGVGGRVETTDGVALASRTSFWFAVVASFPDVVLGP